MTVPCRSCKFGQRLGPVILCDVHDRAYKFDAPETCGDYVRRIDASDGYISIRPGPGACCPDAPHCNHKKKSVVQVHLEDLL